MKIIFAGTPEFAVPALQALIDSSHDIIGVYTQPDRPSGRGRHYHPSPVKILALQHNLSIFQPKTLRDVKAQQEFADLQADIMIVAAYGLILPKVILETPKYGCINIHASLLPRWRGAAPIHRAILAGDTETGITIMQMAEGLDTGDILSKAICAIEPRDTLKTLHDKLADMGALSLMTMLDNLDDIKPEKQDESFSTYAAKISKTEANLDWSQSAENLHRAIRAFYPAYSYIEKQLVKIWEANISPSPQTPPLKKGAAERSEAGDLVRSFSKNPPSAFGLDPLFQRGCLAASMPPGTIIQTHPDRIDIQTGNGILSLKKLQLAGGKILSAKEILNSRSNLFAKGNRFYADHH